jgi:hypothetical protein
VNFLVALLIASQEPSVDDLIKALRSDKVEERAKAAAELKKRGEAAAGLLEKAARDTDPNVSRQAREVLAAIRDPLL